VLTDRLAAAVRLAAAIPRVAAIRRVAWRLHAVTRRRCATAVVGRAARLGVPLLHPCLLAGRAVRLVVHPTTVSASTTPRGSRTRFVVAAIAAAIGVVWTLQGVGALPGSFMTGDMFWAWAGAAIIGGAALYAAWPRLRRR
jgi:hypothetical protein